MKKLSFFLLSACLFLSFKTHAMSEPTDEAIDSAIDSLSFDQKVGQLFLSFFHGSSLDEETKRFIERAHLGNFLYFSWANKLSDPRQVRRLSDELYDFVSKINNLPPLICIDQEGGIVSRLRVGYSQFPGNMALGAAQDEALSYKVGKAIGRELKESGIHLNLAPVVDVHSNLENPVIGVRSFSGKPLIVATLAKKMIQGFHEENIGSALKHFPGHGDTTLNSHTHLPCVRKTLKELQATELIPFASLKNDADCILTAHVIYPALDATNPATLSAKIITDFLRKSLGFDGVVLSDSLMMRGVSRDQSSFERAVASISKAAIKAFLAGCDLLIVSRTEWADFLPSREEDEELIIRVVENFKRAVKEGIIPQERLHDSLKRILRLKAKYAHKNTKREEIYPQEALSREVAQKSLTLLSSEKLWNQIDTRLSGKNWVVIAPEELREPLEESCKNTRLSPSLFYFTNEELKTCFLPTLEKVKEKISSSSLALFLSYLSPTNKEQKELLGRLAKEYGKEQLVIAGCRNPQDLFQINDHLTLLTYSPSTSSLSALLLALENHEKPRGILPLSVLPSKP